MAEVLRDKIIEEALSIEAPDGLGAELTKAFQLARVIDPLALRTMLDRSGSDENGSQREIVEPSEIDRLVLDKVRVVELKIDEDLKGIDSRLRSDRAKNTYELIGARDLAIANSVTRKCSTIFGSVFEEIACLSPVVIDPKVEFGITIKGIDLILLDSEGVLRHVQMKTQRNTLTGSQQSRSVRELKIHPSPLFVAALSQGSWTFGSPSIERMDGEDFWDMIGIEFEHIRNSLNCRVIAIQEKYLQ